MKQLLFTAIFGLALAGTAAAQEKVYSSSGKPLNRSEKNIKSDKLIDPSRIIFGGWGLFGIGSGVTNIGVTPILGYRVTEKFSAGIGFGYQFFHVKNYNSVIVDPNSGAEEYRPLNANIYSPSLWMRYIIWNNIFTQVEYEHNIISQTVYTNDFTNYPTIPIIKDKQTISVPCLLVGGGIRQPMSERTSFVMMILYDVLQDVNSPYYKTVAIRLGINVGF